MQELGSEFYTQELGSEFYTQELGGEFYRLKQDSYLHTFFE